MGHFGCLLRMSAEVVCLGRIVILLSLARHTESQATTPLPSSNDSSGANCTYNENSSNDSFHNASGLPWCPTTPRPPCVTTCCDAEIKREAKNACMQFAKWGAEPARCALWEAQAERTCNSACSDCTTIGNGMLIQCVFTLQLEMTRASALSYCRSMVQSFIEFQCPSACVDQLAMCYTQGFRDCNARCGNWHACDCYPRVGQEDPSDICVGGTVLLRQDKTPDTCHAYPNLCKAHIRTPCGIYKHCPVDLCIVTNKVCEIRDTCQSTGVCSPTDGQCYYEFLADGSPCDDGLFYTHTDRCQDSVCMGIEDKCLRYDVKCESSNPCLAPTDKVKGACDPPTGSCVFVAKPDGTSCPSQPGMAPKDYDGNCSAGLCRRQVLKPCSDTNCKQKGFCMHPPECDALTGRCIEHWKPDGTTCDDAYGSPVGDICIEGRCIGRVVQDAKYGYAGQNMCEGQGSVQAGVQRYFGDVRSEDACQAQCTADPWCIAYAYGYYTCLIYGGERTRNPDPSYFTGATWTLLDPGVDYKIDHGIICYLKQESAVGRGGSNEAAAWFGLTVTFLVVLPGSWGLCMIWGTMCKSYRDLTGCRCCGSPSDAYVQDLHTHEGGKVVGEPTHLQEKMRYLENNGFESSEQVVSGRGTGMIAADPNMPPDDIDVMKISQANPAEEDMMTDPRGEVFPPESQEDVAPPSPPPPPGA
eukprot:TRINITY_DN9038_c0_g1_i1.p1 TRINITY_DN9038_c0_g1~~TRINITY_DN9038_c0_g1_i1.p1  ORF type:complete len:708 (+),score=79.82 TRINITY_DN9038_c0_g1_i1:34-2124(+)